MRVVPKINGDWKPVKGIKVQNSNHDQLILCEVCKTIWSVEGHIIIPSKWSEDEWGKLGLDKLEEWQRLGRWWECPRGCNL